jgi:hypothetical protein
MERTAEFDALVERSEAYLKERQAPLEAKYRLPHWPRYKWSQETAQLVFTEEGHPRVVAEILFVGSISTQSDTWLWAWANDSVNPRLHSEMGRVRGYGEAHSFPQLTTAKWHGHEVDGWEMTSIAAYVLQAVGAYRLRQEFGFTYVVMTHVRWAS